MSPEPIRQEPVDLAAKLAAFGEHWSPRIVAGFNGHDVMVVKVQGEFVWHSHPETDDFFFVLKGRLTIRMREGDVTLCPASSSWCPRASSIVPWRRRKPTSSSSSRPARPTRAILGRPRPNTRSDSERARGQHRPPVSSQPKS